MRSIVHVGACLAVATAWLSVPQASAAGPTCVGGDAGGVPGCRSTWREATTRDVEYDIRCEYACTRGREPWHAPACRCAPPSGDVVVKKRLYKTEGDKRVERVPHYEVEMPPAAGCGCAACRAARPSGGSFLDFIPVFRLQRGAP